jgi:peptidoglycan-associated lipoprotein
MKSPILAVLCVAALSLGACQNADRFGADGPGGEAGFAPVTPVDPSAAAPNTIAYFNTTVGDRVLFAVDQSTLSDSAKATLAAQAQWLGQNPEFTAIIEGHADEQGTREYNLALGERRASAVRDYLITQGVSAARLRTVTYGKERPIEICSTEACYAKNRRAVTVVAAGSGAGV